MVRRRRRRNLHHGRRKPVLSHVAQQRQLRRRQGLEPRHRPVRPHHPLTLPLRLTPHLQHHQLRRLLPTAGKRLPRRLRLDPQPARRILRRRVLRHLQPLLWRATLGERDQRRRHLRHFGVDPHEPALHRRDKDLSAVLVRPHVEACGWHRGEYTLEGDVLSGLTCTGYLEWLCGLRQQPPLGRLFRRWCRLRGFFLFLPAVEDNYTNDTSDHEQSLLCMEPGGPQSRLALLSDRRDGGVPELR